MNPVLSAIKASLGLLASFLPGQWGALVRMIAGTLSTLDFPTTDSRTEKVAQMVSDLLRDLNAAMQIEDASAQERMRLIIENRALRAIVELTPGGGV